jgi:hypothetical protein
MEDMKKELKVDKKDLSSNVRNKISARDDRPSAQSLGALGIVIITLVFAALIACDVMTLKRHISRFFHGIA